MASNVTDYKTKDFLPIQAVILSGEMVSSAIQVSGATAVGILLPAGMTSTIMTFLVSADGVDYRELADRDDNLVSQTIGINERAYCLTPALFFPWNYIKLVVNQAEAAERTIGIMPGVI